MSKPWVLQCEFQNKCGRPATYRYSRAEYDIHDGISTFETYRCDDHAGRDLAAPLDAWYEQDLAGGEPAPYLASPREADESQARDTTLGYKGKLSACCGEPVISGFCSGCGEHA